MRALVNGIVCDSVAAEDRGLHYGDGVFETMAVIDGQARYFSRHMRRLARGCEILGMPAPEQDLLAREIRQLCPGSGRAVVKLIVTRGQGERGYAPPQCPAPTRILLSYPWPDDECGERREGITVRICAMRLALNESLAGVKHLNRLEQVLARAEWTDPEVGEGLMFDSDGYLAEGVHSNVFLVSGGRLRTPLLDRCGVAGIIRERVLEIAREDGIATDCCRLDQEDLRAADEVFLTGTLSGIVPVTRVDQQRFAVGAMTLKLHGRLSKDAKA